MGSNKRVTRIEVDSLTLTLTVEAEVNGEAVKARKRFKSMRDVVAIMDKAEELYPGATVVGWYRESL